MGVVATDNFNRADGGLGANWTAHTTVDNAFSIVSNKAKGNAAANSGATRTAETYASDQYSSIESTDALTTGQWIGATVRETVNGSQLYIGIYFFSDPSYVMQVYKRAGGSFTQLGSTFGLGISQVPAGTVFKLAAQGTAISFLRDGDPKISVTDGTWATGAPGIMTAGAATLDNWEGGEFGSASKSPPRFLSFLGRGAG